MYSVMHSCSLLLITERTHLHSTKIKKKQHALVDASLLLAMFCVRCARAALCAPRSRHFSSSHINPTPKRTRAHSASTDAVAIFRLFTHDASPSSLRAGFEICTDTDQPASRSPSIAAAYGSQFAAVLCSSLWSLFCWK